MESNQPTQDRGESNGPEGSERIRVGDHVTDKENEEQRPILVTALPSKTAREYEFKSGTTVAAVNEEYPETDAVVECVFVQRTDRDLNNKKTYAYPESRLELRHPIHTEGDADSEESGQQTLGGSS